MFICYTWAGLLCSQECLSTKRPSVTARKALAFAQVNALFSVCSQECWSTMTHLLRLGRLWYSYRWVHCLLCCSQECLSAIHSSVTPRQAPVFAQMNALFSVQPGMLEYNTFTCYTRAGSGIRTDECIVLCVARNAVVQYILIRSPVTPGQALVFAQVIALFSM